MLKLLVFIGLFHMAAHAEVSLWNKVPGEFGVTGELVSAYYQGPKFAGPSDEMALVFNIKASDRNVNVSFTKSDIPIAASLISALGKEVLVSQKLVEGKLTYTLQAIEPIDEN